MTWTRYFLKKVFCLFLFSELTNSSDIASKNSYKTVINDYNKTVLRKNRDTESVKMRKNGVPGWTRTNGPLINSQML